jgi:hypothetical protein
MEYDLADNEHGFGRHVYDYSDKADEHSGTDEDDDFVNNPMLLAATEPQIEDNTPAAAALRANANVKVSTVGKAARAVHMQSVRKLIKRATGTTHSGFVRGKPPRLPPDVQEEEQSQGEEVSLEAHEQHNRRAIHGSSALHPPFHHPQPLQPHPHAHSLAHPPLPTQAPQAIPPTSLESTVVLGVRVQPHDVDSADVMPDAVVKGTVEAGKKGEHSQRSCVDCTHSDRSHNMSLLDNYNNNHSAGLRGSPRHAQILAMAAQEKSPRTATSSCQVLRKGQGHRRRTRTLYTVDCRNDWS